MLNRNNVQVDSDIVGDHCTFANIKIGSVDIERTGEHQFLVICNVPEGK
jgi:hypothetical protein